MTMFSQLSVTPSCLTTRAISPSKPLLTQLSTGPERLRFAVVMGSHSRGSRTNRHGCGRAERTHHTPHKPRKECKATVNACMLKKCYFCRYQFFFRTHHVKRAFPLWQNFLAAQMKAIQEKGTFLKNKNTFIHFLW